MAQSDLFEKLATWSWSALADLPTGVALVVVIDTFWPIISILTIIYLIFKQRLTNQLLMESLSRSYFDESDEAFALDHAMSVSPSNDPSIIPIKKEATILAIRALRAEVENCRANYFAWMKSIIGGLFVVILYLIFIYPYSWDEFESEPESELSRINTADEISLYMFFLMLAIYLVGMILLNRKRTEIYRHYANGVILPKNYKLSYYYSGGFRAVSMVKMLEPNYEKENGK